MDERLHAVERAQQPQRRGGPARERPDTGTSSGAPPGGGGPRGAPDRSVPVAQKTVVAAGRQQGFEAPQRPGRIVLSRQVDQPVVGDAARGEPLHGVEIRLDEREIAALRRLTEFEDVDVESPAQFVRRTMAGEPVVADEDEAVGLLRWSVPISRRTWGGAR